MGPAGKGMASGNLGVWRKLVRGTAGKRRNASGERMVGTEATWRETGRDQETEDGNENKRS